MGVTQKINTQLLVLGGGPGGYSAAFRAADLGLDVTIVEQRATLGGVCLNEGCIPSKALLDTVKKMADAQALSLRGIEFSPVRPKLDSLRDWKDSVIGNLTKGLKGLANQRNVRVIEGHGRFVGPNLLSVSEYIEVSFEQVIVAVGSSPTWLPFLPKDPRIMDSKAALELEDIPPKLLIIGGGIIGVEMATVYAGLGSSVTVVEVQPQIIPSCDPELVAPLAKKLRGLLEALHMNTKVTAAKALVRGIEVQFEGQAGKFSETYDRVLVSIGRNPNTDALGLDFLGLSADKHGLIAVDKQQRTDNARVFAIGDVVAGPMLAHKASHEGCIAAEAAAGLPSINQAHVIAQVVYCDPEIAWVGLTEPELKQQGLAYERAIFPWAASGRANAMGCTDGVTKLLVDPLSKKILGVGIVGQHAGDLIAEAALAIEAELEPGDIALTIHPHPTLSETLAFTAQAYEGTLTELYLPRRT